MKRLLIALILITALLAPVAAQQGSTRYHPDHMPPQYDFTGHRAVYWPEMPLESEWCFPEQKPIDHPWHYPFVICRANAPFSTIRR